MNTSRRNDGCRARALTMENLESRRMFAGNITVTYDPDAGFYGTLSITGDSSANQFIIVAGSNDTTIRGLDGTTVNGFSGGSINTLPDLVIDTGNGDDEVEIVDLFSNLSVRAGNGNDTVKITDDRSIVLAFDYFDIDTGNGDDYVEVWNLNTFDADLNILTGNGNDTLRLLGNIEVRGDATIDMGNGSDTIDEKFLFDFFATGTTLILGNETVVPPLI